MTRTAAPPDPHLRILVVDDEVEIVELLGEYLRARGHTVDLAEDGPTGLQEATRGGYDVVLTDLKLPGCNGMDVVTAARATEPPSAVVVMTGFGTVETATQALAMGASDYLLKPFRLRDVYATVLRAAERARATRRAQRAPRLLAFHEACLDLGPDAPLEPLLAQLRAAAEAEAHGPVAGWLARAAEAWQPAWAPPEPLATSGPDALPDGVADGRVVVRHVTRAGARVCLAALPDTRPEARFAHRLDHLARALAAALDRSAPA